MIAPAGSEGNGLPEEFEAPQHLLKKLLRDLPAGGSAGVAALLQVFTSADERQLEKLHALEAALYRDHLSLWLEINQPDGGILAQTISDRSDAPEWQLPFFQYVKRAYSLNANFLVKLGDLANLEPQAKRRLQFQLRQIVDAMSPSNSAATNPEVIKLAAETGGESLVQGMKLLAKDLERGRISMSDELAFEVGGNLATTPGAVVFENEVMQLIQYAPTTAQVHRYPLLIIPPFINKYYILDLQPENSFVRFCVEQGFTTFIVSWRNIPPELGSLGWEDYIEKGVLAPLDAVKEISGAESINTLGYCIGGTLLSCALAVLESQNENHIGSASLLATMLDYSDSGEISVYIDRNYVERSEEEFAHSGSVSGSMLASTFATLRANDLIWYFVINSYLKGRTPRPFDLLYWNTDGSNLPGRLYTYYLRNMYLENNLRIPGKLQASGVPLDLGAISVPAFVVAAREDHIVPWKSAYSSARLLGQPAHFILAASGHVAGIVNPASRNRRHYWLNPSAGSDADAWLAGATQKMGSWWWHWIAWLRSRSGKLQPATAQLGNAKFPQIEAAPGRYVKQKSA